MARPKKESKPLEPLISMEARGDISTPKTLTTPEELQDVWTEEAQAAYTSLLPKQQEFLLEYIRSKFVGMKAYRKVYNPLASDEVARSCASRMLTNVNVRVILKLFQDTAIEDMFLVRNTFKEAAESAFKPIYGKDDEGQPIRIEEIPDYAIRVKAAAELREYHAPALKFVPPDASGVTTQFTTQFNFYLQQLGAAPIRLPNTQEAVDVTPSKDFASSFKAFSGA